MFSTHCNKLINYLNLIKKLSIFFIKTLSMLFHSEAEKNFNLKAYELISLMEAIPVVKIEKENKSGSIKERSTHDLTDKMANRPIIVSSINILDEKRDIYEENNETKIGFNKTTYPTFVNFIRNLYKIKTVSNRVTFNFLYEISFKWMLKVFKNNQADSDYTLFISQEIENTSDDWKYRYEILNLEIEKAFKLGNVQIEYFTKDFIMSLPFISEENRDDFIKNYRGKVYATVNLQNVEKSRGKEIAYIESCKALDVLKLFSPTIAKPTYRTDFDIDKRINSNSKSETITCKHNEEGFNISWNRESKTHEFSSQTIDRIILASEDFIKLICIEEPNELQLLLLNSIEMYSEAISNSNLHKRIVDMLTIWESLLLKDASIGIQDSVSMYASKLLKRTVEERKEFISFFKGIYAIRSARIHHGKELDLALEDIAKFQLETINLIQKLILGSYQHNDKKSLLQEIDDVIHAAG